MRVLNDDDVRAAPASMVVAAAREALLQAARGELDAPPRVRTELGSLDYVFTAGALADGSSGFRAYRAGQPAGDQLVAVWDADGALTGLVVGEELGARRTGALGAVAGDALARPDAHTVGLVGTGRQAWAQLWALAAVRDLRQVRVYSPSEQHREDFAARARSELGFVASATSTSPPSAPSSGTATRYRCSSSPQQQCSPATRPNKRRRTPNRSSPSQRHWSPWPTSCSV